MFSGLNPDSRDGATMICLNNNVFIYGGKSASMKNNIIYYNMKNRNWG